MVFMKIELVQGDTSEMYRFQRKTSDDKVITTLPQKMWITFKETCNCDEHLFQKTLENGITYNETDNYYRFQIQSEDTAELPYGLYGFDIAILNEAGKKKTLLRDGILELLKHYTKKKNEV
jgi:hypothetical protein